MRKMFADKFTTLLIIVEYIIHASVALTLIMAGFIVFIQSFNYFDGFNSTTVFMLINNALLMLIIKEVLWTAVKFFKKQRFSLGSFLFIGVISSVRQILLLEVQKSVEKMPPAELALELGVYAITILILITAYYIFNKAQNISANNEEL